MGLFSALLETLSFTSPGPGDQGHGSTGQSVAEALSWATFSFSASLLFSVLFDLIWFFF
ncbi:hypothetical protein BDV38DRAFT_235362 [Aspergillus pseudotamarii]|uniref:Uncharacterized protein n=1 Tax=Aspergillus pseudotamarii TaxID=132259 RepID=A0A5N6T8D1_ASPPS|nr:uncharacterized protein BDV38DRAFT_235362 [Aspergillus pseudotamarii]KAE8142638.1 hypothetical protein BDV38DRAFT_235362 [Aspergillus pseudotamarii]